MKQVLLVLAIIGQSVLYAQLNKVKYADVLFQECNYFEAGEVYAELADKSLKEKNVDTLFFVRAGASLYNTRKYALSVIYFSKVYKSSLMDVESERKYVDAMIRTGNKTLIKEYRTWSKKRVVMNYGDMEAIQKKILSDTSSYTLVAASFNSNEGEYGAIKFGDTVYYASSKKDIGYTHSNHGWDNVGFSNVFGFTEGNKAFYLKGLNSELHDGPICFSQDMKKAYATRTEFIKKGNQVVKHVKVYVLSLQNHEVISSEEFLHNGEFNTGHVNFSKDEDTLYFASDRPGSIGGSDIYYCTLDNGKWSDPMNIGDNINTAGDELFPYVSGEDMYYSSNGRIGLGGLDVYRSSLYEKSDAYNLGGGVNSSQDDFCFNMDLNTMSGYVSSDREGNVDRVYIVKTKIVRGTLIVHAKDKIKSKDLKDASIWLIDRASNDSLLVTLTEKGEYTIPVEGRKDYIISGYKKNYELDAPIYFSTDNLKQNEVVEKDLFFNETRYDLIVKTVTKGNGDICPGVSGVFTDPVTKQQISFVTGDNGIAMVNIEKLHTYEVIARKKGYLHLTEIVHTNSEVLIELDLQMLEIKKDVVFEIKNILYDLAKWDLRPESKVELDKLVEFLKLNDNIKVELSAHTDSRSSANYNQDLSQKRSQSCVNYLIEKGIEKTRIVAKGYGESKLLNGCSDGVVCTEEKHQKNRRTEIKILSVN
jgi:outer membrane protein OmpA-like peptidoglycan-associated protein